MGLDMGLAGGAIHQLRAVWQVMQRAENNETNQGLELHPLYTAHAQSHRLTAGFHLGISSWGGKLTDHVDVRPR